ncbi:MAG: bifunctional ADP-dependent NAD(P)H-hydrate dehydratase/NAD(P)H-hydrate epimerase, partial [Chloroflexi bacterium]|nr:bifunctional ADP-dependent NAD(P)H-hydrate dehydratase/NAD(P)H-hydrate epimerase [Chloroflexota bacterium]
MAKIVTTEQMKAVEKAADAKGHSYAAMMELAGRAVAERVKVWVAGRAQPRIAILVGPGNNGGDGLVAGRLLKEEIAGATVGAFLLEPRAEDDTVFTAARDAGVFIADAENDKAQGYRVLQNLVANADVVVDALFGTGFKPPIKGEAIKVLQAARKALALRESDRPAPPYTTPADPPEPFDLSPIILAVDCPSGLDCDSGELDSHALNAHETVTFAAAKPGLLAFPGAEAVGKLHIANIGLPARLPALDKITLTLVEAADVNARLPKRPLDSHKGTFGKAMIAAGSLNYTGAAYLAAAAAYRVGAGLVTVGAPQIIIPTLAAMLPEATWVLLPHDMGVLNEAAVKVLRKELEGYTALLLGPGFGTEDVTGDFLRDLLQPKEELRHSRAMGFVPMEADQKPADANNSTTLPPLVLDADGLNLLADMDDWTTLIPPNTILTPHPAEFARLAKIERDEVQK